MQKAYSALEDNTSAGDNMAVLLYLVGNADNVHAAL